MTDPALSDGQPFLINRQNHRAADLYIGALSAFLGSGVAGVAAAAYYSTELRPLAHTYGIWVLFAFAVASARQLRAAVIASTVFLLASVVVFFIGVKVFHDVKWAASGSSLGVSWDRMTLWLSFAVPAGVVLGLAGHLAGKGGWRGDVSRAGVLGVLVAEALDRVSDHGVFDTAVFLDSAAAVGLLIYFWASGIQLRHTIAAVPLTLTCSLFLVQVPDFLEQLIAS